MRGVLAAGTVGPPPADVHGGRRLLSHAFERYRMSSENSISFCHIVIFERPSSCVLGVENSLKEYFIESTAHTDFSVHLDDWDTCVELGAQIVTYVDVFRDQRKLVASPKPLDFAPGIVAKVAALASVNDHRKIVAFAAEDPA